MLLTEWRKEKSTKVLIFTKSVKLLEMLEFHLGKLGQHLQLAPSSGANLCHVGYGFLKLDGTTKQSDRERESPDPTKLLTSRKVCP